MSNDLSSTSLNVTDYCMLQWKVRRTLAFSIHELAVIVGEENTTRDLVPVFNGFLKDLDEVRIGVLKHLADFLNVRPTSWAFSGYNVVMVLIFHR